MNTFTFKSNPNLPINCTPLETDMHLEEDAINQILEDADMYLDQEAINELSLGIDSSPETTKEEPEAVQDISAEYPVCEKHITDQISWRINTGAYYDELKRTAIKENDDIIKKTPILFSLNNELKTGIKDIKEKEKLFRDLRKTLEDNLEQNELEIQECKSKVIINDVRIRYCKKFKSEYDEEIKTLKRQIEPSLNTAQEVINYNSC